jgi:hypothetical protein
MPICTNIGAVSFRLRSARNAHMPRFAAVPFIELEDGTVVARLDHRGRHYLVIDHRLNVDGAAHVERWESQDAAEGLRPTLLVLCDAA